MRPFCALSDPMDRPYLSRNSAGLFTLHLYTTFEMASRFSPPVPGGYESSLPASLRNGRHYSVARYERRQGAALRQVGWPQYPGRRESPGDQRQIQPDIQSPPRPLEREALAGPLEYWGRSRVQWFAQHSARQ